MRYFFILILLTINLASLYCQPGFATAYDLDSPGSSFTNISMDKDKVLVYGAVIDNTTYDQALVFAQFDTNGVLLNYHTLIDSVGDAYFPGMYADIVTLEDNSGYLVLANIRGNGTLIFLDKNGAFKNTVEYPDSTTIWEDYRGVTEINGGFLIFGVKKTQDFAVGVFVMKTDKKGNKIWEKRFNSPSRKLYYSSHYFMDDNTIVIGCYKIQSGSNSISNWSNQNVIMAIDSLGNDKWRWESQEYHSPESFIESGVHNLQKTSEGNWIYSTVYVDLYPAQNVFRPKGKIMVRDSAFNLVWEKVMLPSSVLEGWYYQLVHSPDNNWVASGYRHLYPAVTGNYGAYLGWSTKFNNTGDVIWDRIDSVFYSPNAFVLHYLYGSIALPSGSTIACGKIENGAIPKDFGWLLKISKDGCVDTLNCFPLSSFPEPPKPSMEIDIFPNPARDKIFFSSPEKLEWERIELYDAAGRHVKTWVSTRENYVDLGPFAPGVYYLRFIHAGKIVSKMFCKL